MKKRNRDYESYYFKHLKRSFTGQNLTKAAQIANAILLLWLYTQNAVSIGLLITLTITIFTRLFSSEGLAGCTHLFRWAGFHIKTFDFYSKYFNLSEDEYGEDNDVPAELTIEFKNVHFKYPGTETEILKGLNFKINHGEKVSFVGENGEGKSTIIKLLLGLFQPDSGEILVGNKPLKAYSQAVRNHLFGAVFQDFMKYSITLSENIGVGDIDKVDDNNAIIAAMQKAKADIFVQNLPDGMDTLLGRDFDGGVDLSGGQWQRIAIARAFMGNKPILILDEPTSQLDPMAESRIYSEFSKMAEGKTSIFITHRLASTMITDRIYVIANGCISQSGTHGELIAQGGKYAEMFKAQKQWYLKGSEVTNFND